MRRLARAVPNLCLAAALAAAPAGARAAPSRKPAAAPAKRDFRAGVQLGVGIPTADTFGDGRLVLGMDFYFVHDAKLDLGFSYLTGSKGLPNGRRVHSSLLGAELNYKLPHVAEGFYVGAAGGITSADFDYVIIPDLDHLYLGPKAGFWRFFSPEFSFGAEAKLLFVTADPIFAWLHLLGAVRFHF